MDYHSQPVWRNGIDSIAEKIHLNAEEGRVLHFKELPKRDSSNFVSHTI